VKRWTAFLLALGLSACLTACGSDGEAESNLDSSEDDSLTACLIEKGFTEPTAFVATVVVDGAERLTTMAFPEPISEDNYLVVYEAPNAMEADEIEASYAGGPFIDQVGSFLFATTSEAPSHEDQAQIRACLKVLVG
jgi:hypothetical protein